MLKRRTAALIALALGAAGVLAGVLVLGGGAAAGSPQPARAPRPKPALMARLGVPILMYHYVNDTPPDAGSDAASLTVSKAQFEAEMEHLAEYGYHPVTMQEVYAALSGGGVLPSKPVALTFDDGGTDGYTVALPILRKHGFKATFFVITGYVGNRHCMTWSQLREMCAAGMDIESHTVRHPDLRKIDASRLASELAVSRATLAKELGVDARIISYPFGRYNETVIAAAQAAGYQAAVTTSRPGLLSVPLSSYVWQRTNISRHTSLSTFARVVSGARRVAVR